MIKKLSILALASLPLSLGAQFVESFNTNWSINMFIPTSVQHNHTDPGGSAVTSSVSVGSIPAFDQMLADLGYTNPAGYTLQSVEVMFGHNATDFTRRLGAGQETIRYTSYNTTSLANLAGPGGLSIDGQLTSASNTWAGFGQAVTAGSLITFPPPLSQSAFSTSQLLTGAGVNDFLGFGALPLSVGHTTNASWTTFGTSSGSFARITGTNSGAIMVTYNFSPIPEPGTVVAGVLFAGLIGFVAFRRFRKSKADLAA